METLKSSAKLLDILRRRWRSLAHRDGEVPASTLPIWPLYGLEESDEGDVPFYDKKCYRCGTAGNEYTQWELMIGLAGGEGHARRYNQKQTRKMMKGMTNEDLQQVHLCVKRDHGRRHAKVDKSDLVVVAELYILCHHQRKALSTGRPKPRPGVWKRPLLSAAPP